MSLLGLCLLSGLDSPPAYADFTFSEPARMESVIPPLDPYHDSLDCFSDDGLEMYMSSDRPGGQGNLDLWILRRASKDETWGSPENLGLIVNSSKTDAFSSISADGLTLYFTSDRPGGYGRFDTYMTTRVTKDAPWGPPVNLGPLVNSSHDEAGPCLSADGLELYFNSYNRSGGYGSGDIYVARRATVNDAWREAVNLGPLVNTAYDDGCPCLSPDGLILFFSDNSLTLFRPGGYGGADMWMTRRANLSAPWQAPVNLGPKVNGPTVEGVPNLTPDGSTLYFQSDRAGSMGYWQAAILPVVDFNGDGIVDIVDVGIMIEYWHTDDPLCDIGPMPWGDGFVDAQDLSVLVEYLFEGSRPTAHWKLDEEEGDTAYDSAGPYDADLHGGPVWQPSGGMEGGALEFDGIDDYVSTPFILDPATGSFSVFAWIKSGDRGQVIISQNDGTGTRWLWTDPSYGRLITWVMHPPFDPLMSESTITDDQWHHVGLVYDFEGFRRHLYVDGAQVAQDTDAVGGVGSSGGLYFGAEKTLGAGTFFSGLIDDVRIYNKALSEEEIAALAQ